MKVVFHRADLDGQGSGAVIFKKFYSELVYDRDFIPYNYGEEFPFHRIEPEETVVMADICLEPFSEMERLANYAKLIWIDHHKTAIDQYQNSGLRLAGLRKEGEAACSLSWRYFFPNQPVPLALRYLAEYDVWNHTNPSVLPFQYGMRLEYTWVNSQIWTDVWISDPAWISSIISKGTTVLKYERQHSQAYLKAYGFETEFEGLKALALNRGMASSMAFCDSINDYDIVILFTRKGGEWKVGLYTVKDNIDCGALAHKYGGGGHRQASGFRTTELPFRW